MVHGVGVLLLSAVGGYWVLERAANHKGTLKQVGQLVGGIIIVVSLIGMICDITCVVSGTMGYCPFGKVGRSSYGSRPSKGMPDSPTPQ